MTIVASVTPTTVGILSLTFDGTYIYAGDTSGNVYKIDPSTMTVVESVNPNGSKVEALINSDSLKYAVSWAFPL